MKKVSTIIALAFVATTAVAQQPVAPKAPTDPIVIAAGDLTIRQSEFENALRTLPAEYQQYAMGPGKKQFAEDYLRMRMLAAEGVKAGLDKDPEVVRQLELMRENLVANAQLQKIEASVVVPDEKLEAKYEASKAQYEQVAAKHILIAFKGSPAANPEKPELTEEQAKAKADALHKQIVGGASFDELAKNESDDLGSGARGGDLGSFSRGQMVPEFEKAAFEAKVGDVTAPVRTQFGYHIIKVDKHESTPFEEVKPTLEKEARQEMVQARLDEMKNNAKVTFNDTYFAVPAAVTAEPAAHTEGDGHKH